MRTSQIRKGHSNSLEEKVRDHLWPAVVDLIVPCMLPKHCQQLLVPLPGWWEQVQTCSTTLSLSRVHGQQLKMPLSPGSGQWLVWFMLDDEGMKTDDGPIVSDSQQVLIRRKEKVARLWIFGKSKAKDESTRWLFLCSGLQCQGSSVCEDWWLDVSGEGINTKRGCNIPHC